MLKKLCSEITVSQYDLKLAQPSPEEFRDYLTGRLVDRMLGEIRKDLEKNLHIRSWHDPARGAEIFRAEVMVDVQSVIRGMGITHMWLDEGEDDLDECRKHPPRPAPKPAPKPKPQPEPEFDSRDLDAVLADPSGSW